MSMPAEFPQDDGSPQSRLWTFVPQFAEELLRLYNHDNRRPIEAVLERYAADMAADNWHVGTGNITLSSDGRLLDGQHRLMACVRANRPFTAFLVTNIKPEAHDGIDQGKIRTLDNALQWDGEVGNTKDLAAAIRASWRWVQHPENPYAHHARALSFDEGKDWLKRNPSLRQATARAKLLVSDVRMPGSLVSAVLHRIHLIDSDAAELLEVQVRDGTRLEKGDPALALRRWVTSSLSVARRTDQPYLHVAWIQTWNAFIAGRQMQIVRWKRTEAYPQLCDERGRPVPFVDECSNSMVADIFGRDG
jgi:hypothetical protein